MGLEQEAFGNTFSYIEPIDAGRIFSRKHLLLKRVRGSTRVNNNLEIDDVGQRREIEMKCLRLLHETKREMGNDVSFICNVLMQL